MIRWKDLPPLLFGHRLTEVTYFVTSRCNLKCQHCFIIKRLNTELDELSVEEIARIGEHIGPLQRVFIGGGEPFMRKDIAEVLSTISDKWDPGVMCIPTNGTYPDQVINAVETLGGRLGRRYRLHLSMNAFGREYADFVGVNYEYDKWLSNARKISNAASGFDNITLVALMAVGSHLVQDTDSLLRVAVEELCVDDISLGLVREHNDYQPTPDVVAFRRLVKRYMTGKSRKNTLLETYRTLIREYQADYYDTPHYQVPCQAGKLRVVIAPEGSVYPCEKLGYPETEDLDKWLVGNVRDYDYNLPALLMSKRAKEIQIAIRNSRCHCQQCIDLALNLMTSHRFKAGLLARWVSKTVSKVLSSVISGRDNM